MAEYETQLEVHVERINEGPKESDVFDIVATDVEISKDGFLMINWEKGGSKGFSFPHWQSVTINRRTVKKA